MRTLSPHVALCVTAALVACSVNPVAFTLGDGRPTENCKAAGDEDGNGLADCSDPACASAPWCQPACGNGRIEMGEGCDDGNAVNGDACERDCTLSRCGNNIIDSGEACDDGNAINGDACETNCTLPRCGNNIIDSGEACDDGNAIDGDGCEHTCKVTGSGSYATTSDAMILTSDASTNYGAQPELLTYGSSFGTVARSLIAFDLAALAIGTPIHAAYLHVRMVDQAGVDYAIEVHEALGPWSEGSVTWDNQPAFSPAIETSLGFQGYTSWRFEVTALVQRWVSTPSANNGLVLTQDPELFTSGAQFARFASREGGDRPYLDIVVGN